MFEMIGNPDKQGDMEKYMRQQFQFLGLQTPERKAQSKALIQQSKKLPIRSVHSLIADLYDWVEREYQYVAIDVAYANITRFTYSDLKELTQYIQRKSWWDTVDSWRKIYGKFVVLHSEQKGQFLICFINIPTCGCVGSQLFCSFMKKKRWIRICSPLRLTMILIQMNFSFKKRLAGRCAITVNTIHFGYRCLSKIATCRSWPKKRPANI